MPTAGQINATIDAYEEAYRSNDKAAFLALWDEGGELEDPVGTPVHVGMKALGAFWDSTRQLVDRIELVPDEVVVCADQAAMVFTILARTGDGGLRMRAIDVFRIDDDGKIASVRAYWDIADATPV